jgi:8-oxo-dGTP diphosphatase
VIDVSKILEKGGILIVRKTRQKAFAYITHQNRLLVFRHVDVPEAGIQVPAGTIKVNEHPEQAVLREAVEETGLTDLTVEKFLGKQEREMSDFGRDEIHHRFFYHLHCNGVPPSTWYHVECDPSDGFEHEPILFEFFWVVLPYGVPSLIADHDRMLPQLFDFSR